VGAAEALGGLRQNVQDRPFRIVEHIRVPQPEHSPTLALQKCRSAIIRFDLRGRTVFIIEHPQQRVLSRVSDAAGASNYRVEALLRV
jgi:hypothetical protein